MRWSIALVVGALVIASCSSGATATSGPTELPGQAPAVVFTPGPATDPPSDVDDECIDYFADMYDALTDLDGRLAVGLDYEDYGEAVSEITVAYGRLENLEDLDPGCAARYGVKLEGAGNEYIEAFNTWKACVEDTDCDVDANTTTLQAHWADAQELIDEAQEVRP